MREKKIFNIENKILNGYYGIDSSVIIPDNVIIISSNTFRWCKSLEKVTFPAGLRSIEEYAFAECLCLTEITLPDGITNIGPRAFADCIKLTDITIPDSVKSIGPDAFEHCEQLRISCNPGSYAEKYAKETGIPVILCNGGIGK